MQKLSVGLYQLVMLLLTPVLMLALLLRSRSQVAYRSRMSERLGLLPANLGATDMIVHAASVGEVIAIKPLIEQLLANHPDRKLTVTTFTATGSEQVKKAFNNRVQHCYLPFDNPLSVRLFLHRLRPKVLVVMETELWPTLIQCAKSQLIKLVLINARLSEKSLGRYQKLSALVEPSLKAFDSILAQSEDNRARFITLGASADVTQTLGNLKFDIQKTASLLSKVDILKSKQHTSKQYWVVGSTHPQDEVLIFDVFAQLKQTHENLVLVIVPRHPERFDAVYKALLAQQWQVIRHSQNQDVGMNTDVWLVDSLGELVAFYALADVCTVAGSFGGIGGHNPLEAALFAKPIIVGADMANFTEITDKLLAADGIVQVRDKQQLVSQTERFLTDVSLAAKYGQGGLSVVQANQGATTQTAAVIASLGQFN